MERLRGTVDSEVLRKRKEKREEKGKISRRRFLKWSALGAVSLASGGIFRKEIVAGLEHLATIIHDEYTDSSEIKAWQERVGAVLDGKENPGVSEVIIRKAKIVAPPDGTPVNLRNYPSPYTLERTLSTKVIGTVKGGTEIEGPILLTPGIDPFSISRVGNPATATGIWAVTRQENIKGEVFDKKGMEVIHVDPKKIVAVYIAYIEQLPPY